MPTNAEKNTASNTAPGPTAVAQPASCEISNDAPIPNTIPTNPPAIESVTASTRNCVRMSRVLAPSACLNPISRVRSRTEISMMFMIPMPPTTSETEATAASMIAMIFEDASWAAKIMAIMLAAVASVSLVVGGIGIMNIILISVRERTREIGLRQAVGAKTRDILTQFLVEAVTLSIAGGFIGIVFGIGASLLISQLAGWATAVGPGAVLLAVFFSALVGIGFGYYPARKAAYLDPIEALRNE